MPCRSPYLSPAQRQFLTSWIFAWAIGVAFSTLLVQVTFVLDMKRFKYPERPIVYLSLCYLFVAIGYVIKWRFDATVDAPTDNSLYDTCYRSQDNGFIFIDM